ncbi:MAG: hypothetical protein IJ730_01860 [Alphaproteobacteria bacterium]|nr:hypothetical protein [Alphaproteobacteria bacterium]
MSVVVVDIIAETVGELRKELKRLKKAKIDLVMRIRDPIKKDVYEVYGPFTFFDICNNSRNEVGMRTMEIIKKLASKKKRYPDDMRINQFMWDVNIFNGKD